MREHLIGYLLRALDDRERDEVELALERDPQLQRELELYNESLEPLRALDAPLRASDAPLRASDASLEPPANLAERTCMYVFERRVTVRAGVPLDLAPNSNRWTMTDMAVAAGIFLAAGMLLFPALQHSRENARLATCQNNLRQLGQALAQYSRQNQGYFPAIPTEGKSSAAGMYAVRLKEQGFLPNVEEQVICPGSSLAENRTLAHVPTVRELEAARGERLRQLRAAMGGSYGYNLGYVEGNQYRPVHNRQRAGYAMMADEPSEDLEGRRSANHSSCGQNVLYEDGHVSFLKHCRAQDQLDHIFLNDDGEPAAGVHVDDAVIGRSSAAPLPRMVSFQGSVKSEE